MRTKNKNDIFSDIGGKREKWLVFQVTFDKTFSDVSITPLDNILL